MPREPLVGGGAIAALLLICVAAPAQDAPKPAVSQGPASTVGSQPEQPASSAPFIFGNSFIPAAPTEQSPTASGTDTPGTTPAVPPPDFGGPGSHLFSPFAAGVGHMPLLRADYRASWFPNEPVSGQPTSLGFVRQDVSFACPIWQDEQNEWSASAHMRWEIFHTAAILPDTDQPFPSDLWNIGFATTFRHQFDNGWIGGVTGTIGSASDKPFHDWDVMTGGVNAFLRLPQGEHNAWLFTLSYSPTGELWFPIPGVAYVWQPSDTFRMNVGLPFMLMWRPVEDVQIDLSYMLLRTVHAKAAYRLCDSLRLYTGFDWQNEAYFLAERPQQKDRFFYYDMRLSSGVVWNVSRNVALDLSAGYVFDRFYFEGQRYSDNNFDRVNVGNGPYGALQCLVRW